MTLAERRLPDILRAYPRVGDWLSIWADGRVHVRSGKAEYGQGIRTAVALLVAEELDLPVARIEVEPVDTDLSPDEGVTSGSRSIEESYGALRLAAAEARRGLVVAAAERMGVPAVAMTVDDGRVHAPDGRSVAFADVAAALDARWIRDDVEPKTRDARRLTGRGTSRVDLPAKVTGTPAYVHDIRLPGMLHARVVRPPRPGAQLEAIDEAEVRALSGVVEVVRNGSFLAVVAIREYQAIVALRRARRIARWSASNDPLPSQEHPLGSPTMDVVVRERGDVDALANPPSGGRRVEATYRRPYIAHASIGPSCAVALAEAGRMRVWSHSQGVHYLRDALARVLRMPTSRVRVTHAEGAGCYGANGADDVALDAALVARAIPGRPIRVQWMREDEFAWEPYGTSMVVRMGATLDADGEVAAWTHDAWGNGHRDRPGPDAPEDESNLLAARDLGLPFRPTVAPGPTSAGSGGGRNAAPPYAFPALRAVNHYVPHTPVRVSALRSLGAHTNVFASESFVDELAAARGDDPVAWRLRHLDDPRARRVLEAVAADAGWPGSASSEGDPGYGVAYARYKGSGAYVAIVVEARVGDDFEVVRVWAAVDCGLVVDPDGTRNQAEGGVVQAVSWTLREQVRFDADGTPAQSWDDYPILGFRDAPDVRVRLIDRPDEPPLGVGEAFAGPTAAAVANAAFAATGIRVREMPLTRDRFLAASS
jgi:CO/xanthine dehydrogenase Mo-binding subunit